MSSSLATYVVAPLSASLCTSLTSSFSPITSNGLELFAGLDNNTRISTFGYLAKPATFFDHPFDYPALFH